MYKFAIANMLILSLESRRKEVKTFVFNLLLLWTVVIHLT
jgi:hypothetical protein